MYNIKFRNHLANFLTDLYFEKCVLEISFVLDASDSISPLFFNEEKLFINALVNKYTISSTGNKASVALFSDKAVESIYCDQYHDEKSFSEAVLKLEQIGRYTNIEDGIIKGRNLLTKRGCGRRPNVIKIMIILTDGNANIGNSPICANGPNDLAIAAKEARDFDITIYAVSIGRKINMKYLLVITNNSNSIIKSSSFDQLPKTSLFLNLFPKCIFSSKVITSTTFKNHYTIQSTKPFISIATTSKKTTKMSPLSSFETTNTLANNMVLSSKRFSTLSRLKNILETTVYTAKSFGSKTEDLINNATSFKLTLFTYAVNNKSKEKSPKRKEITSSYKTNLPATSTTDAFTFTESLVTTKKVVNKSSEKLFEPTFISPTNSTFRQLTEKLTTGSEATSSKILTRPAKVKTLASTENISSTLVFSRSELTTPSIEPFVTAEEAVSTSTTTFVESASVPVNSSAFKQFTEEPTTVSEATSSKILTRPARVKTTETIPISSADLTIELSTAKTTEILSVSTASFASSSSVPLLPTCKIEVAFVFDSSDSISFATFNGKKRFVGALVKSIGISKNGNKVSIVLFSSKATKTIYCDEYQDEKLFNRALENLTQNGKFTNIEDGLDKGKKVLQKRGCGIHKDAIRIMLIFTDGVSNTGSSANSVNGIHNLANVAKYARDSGIKIIAITVGKKVKKDILHAITNDTNLVINDHSFSPQLKKNVIKKILTFCYNTSIKVSTPYSITGNKTLDLETQSLSLGSVLPKTVSLDITSSPRDCYGFGSVDSCRCLFNVTSFPKLDLSKFDIESMFNGTCFDDKLLASIKYVSSIMGSILLKKYNFEACRDEIKSSITKKSRNCVDLLFDRFEECTVIINCEIKDIYEKAKQSKMFLENLVKFSEKRFDIFTGISNFIKWIGL
ncbi:uncharacterized protein LOC136086193 [Hydra vulgaris]|uniref:Uncharacterized protein LOC136086193 n=1 Tax=Hydra vulgaris TaxID=6087 RepID=A0ABM4CRQ0_HYDVU